MSYRVVVGVVRVKRFKMRVMGVTDILFGCNEFIIGS